MGDVDKGVLIVGNTSFMKESLKGMTKEVFTKTYEGKISIGVKEAWKQVSKYTK